MPRPHFNADLIGELRAKVISHNQTDGAEPVKLQQLRKAYAAGFKGREPHAAAMAKVEAVLSERLAKVDEPFDESEHPRDGDGKFASKGGGGGRASAPKMKAPKVTAPKVEPPKERPPFVERQLPKTRAEHEKLMRENAGYAAMQTDYLPETRNAALGAMYRDIALFGGGIGLAASLARGKSNGVAARISRRALGSVGRSLGVLGGAAVLNPKKGAELGERLGRRAGQGVFRAGSKGLRSAMYVASAGRKTRAGRAGARAAVVALAGAYPALSVRESVKGTMVDPEVIGHGIDQFDVRQVKKLADTPEMAEAHAAIMEALYKGGDIDDLRKALPGGWSRAGMALWGTAAGAAGALAGAGAGAGAHAAVSHISGNKKGNPYHDEHGRFTSSGNAKSRTLATIGGAVAGGALAAGLAVASMRRGNAKVVKELVNRAENVYARRLDRATTGRGYGTAIKTAMADRAKLDTDRARLIQEGVAKSEPFQAAMAGFERYGGTSALHYQDAIRREINNKIGAFASGIDNFVIPAKKGPGTTVAMIRAGHSEAQKSLAAANAVSKFAANATRDEFEKAIEHLSKEQKTTLMGWFDAKADLASKVDTQLTAHYKKIHDAEAKIEKSREAWHAAQRAEDDAFAISQRANGKAEVEAAESALTAAKANTLKAADAHGKLTASLDKLKTSGPEVRSPVTGNIIPPATPAERQAVLDDVRQTVQKKIEAQLDAKAKKMDKTIEGLREENKGLVGRLHNRHLAVLAMSGQHHGGLPKTARSTGRQLARTRREIKALQQSLRDAIREGKPATDIGKIRSDITAKVKQEATEATAFRDAVRAPAPPKRSVLNMLPEDVRNELAADIKRGTANVKGALNGFLQKPTMRRLEAFANEKARQAKETGKTVADALFMMPDGKGGRQWSFMNTSRTIGRASALALAGKEVNDLGRAAIFGNPDEKAKARKRIASTITREEEFDPITGHGYAALTIAHPTEKGERLIVYGEHRKNSDTTPRMLEAGGRMSKVRQAFKENRLGGGSGDHGEGGGRPHTGDLFGFQGEDQKKAREAIGQRKQDITRENIAGTDNLRISFLSDNKNQPDIANKVRDHIAGRYLNNSHEELKPVQYFHALQAMFSNEASLLTPSQRWEMLTNRTTEGGAGRFKKGIFVKSDNLNTSGLDDASKAKIVSGLSAEIDRAMKMGPNDEQKANLHRALHIAKVAKGLSSDALKPLHAKIGSVGVAKAAPDSQHQAAPKAASGSTHQTQARLDEIVETPKGWSKDDLHRESMGIARKVVDHLGGKREDESLIADAVRNIAKGTAQVHGLSMEDALKATSQAIYSFGGTSHESRQNALDVFRDGFPEHTLADVVDKKVAQIKASNKLFDLDDVDGLMKAFAWDETRHPRQGKGSDHGGEFTSRGGAGAGAVASRGPGPSRRQPAQHQDKLNDFHPVALSRDAGMMAGAEAAWRIAGRYLPTGASASAGLSLIDAISNESGSRVAAKAAEKPMSALAVKAAQRFLPGAFGAAVGAVSMGTKLAVSAAGGAAGSWGGEKAARAVYSAAGKKLPGFSEKPDPLGRSAADAGGQLAGSFVGGALGSAVLPVAGSFVGSVAGSVVGGAAARLAYDAYNAKTLKRMSSWFHGYPETLMHSAMSRFMTQETKHA